jgi:hypothetical protein
MVKTYDQTQSKWVYSKFVAYLHRDESIRAQYISITTESNKRLTISPNHFIARLDESSNKLQFVFAKLLKLNDVLLSENGADRIVKLDNVYESGAFAPLTESGTISVNSLFASCYANTVVHEIAHFVMQPMILFNKLVDYLNVLDSAHFDSTVQSNFKEGILWYPYYLYTLLPYIPFSSFAVVF